MTNTRAPLVAAAILAIAPTTNAQTMHSASSTPVPLTVETPYPPEPAPQVLTLAETIARARANPPAVLVAIAQAHTADAAIGQARTVLLPTVNAQLAASTSLNNSPTPALGMVGGNFLSANAAVDASASARWTVWDFGETALNVHSAILSAQSASLSIQTAIRSAVAQAIVAFYTVLADAQLVASYRETLRQRQRELEITRGLVEVGTNPPIERLRAEITARSAQLDVTNAEFTERVDAATLASALALDPARPLVAVQPREMTVQDDPMRAADEAVRARPETLAAQAQVHSAELALDGARAQWRPQFFLSSNADVGYLSIVNPSPGYSGARESFSLSGGISTPLYNPGITPAIRTAQASLENARGQLALQELSVRTDAATSAIQVRATREALDQSTQLAVVAAANLSQAEGRYSAGAAGMLELVDAQGADATARIAVVRARFQFELAKARLLASLARLDDLARP